jgi:hypothetical protein
MKQLKRNECVILPLVLKGKWYDMIASGEKKEEYRDYKPFWKKRIFKVLEKSRVEAGNPIVIAFSKGYRKADMFFVCDLFLLLRNGNERPRIKIEWGEPETPHFVLQLGKRVELVD